MNLHGRMGSADFDARKALACVGYLAQRVPETMYTVMKLLYLADREHLGRYGRFILGDAYAAMAQGPVPSATYELMKFLRGDRPPVEGAEDAHQFLSYSPEHELEAVREPELGELSESDLECLDHIIGLYRSRGRQAMRALSHDEAWAKAWSDKGDKKSVPMKPELIASILPDAEHLLAFLRDPQPGDARQVEMV